MKRTELERRLTELGWSPVGPTGLNHTAWSKPGRKHRIAVRTVDVIPTATAERLIAEAGG